MTHDDTPRRPPVPTATIPFPGNGPPRGVLPPLHHQEPNGRDPNRTLSYLESVALRMRRLSYGDMKQMATEVLGDAKPTTPTELADLFYQWSVKIMPEDAA